MRSEEPFDYAVLPMNWKQLQPQEGMFFTDEVDEWVEFLSKKRTPIIAGPLISLADTDVPERERPDPADLLVQWRP